MPVATLPVSLRSMCQLSVSPALFLRVKAKTALPCLMASLRSASLAPSASLMASKAGEAGNLSAEERRQPGASGEPITAVEGGKGAAAYRWRDPWLRRLRRRLAGFGWWDGMKTGHNGRACDEIKQARV